MKHSATRLIAQGHPTALYGARGLRVWESLLRGRRGLHGEFVAAHEPPLRRTGEGSCWPSGPADQWRDLRKFRLTALGHRSDGCVMAPHARWKRSGHGGELGQRVCGELGREGTSGPVTAEFAHFFLFFLFSVFLLLLSFEFPNLNSSLVTDFVPNL
jgi:hypothetical protein